MTARGMAALPPWAKASGLLTTARLGSNGLSVVAAVVLARSLGAVSYGYLPLLASLTQVGLIFGDLGLAGSTGYHVAKAAATDGHTGAVIRTAAKLRLITGVVACLVFAIGVALSGTWLHAPLLVDPWVIGGTAILFGSQLGSRWVCKTFEGLARTKDLAGIEALTNWISPASGVTVALLYPNVKVVICCQAAASVGAFLAAGTVLSSVPQTRREKSIGEPVSSAAIIGYGLSLTGVLAASQLYLSGGAIIVKMFCTLDAVSAYAIAMQVATIAQVPALAIAATVVPALANQPPQSVMAEFRRRLLQVCLMYALVSVSIALVGSIAINVLFGHRFAPAGGCLRLLTPFVFSLGVGGFLAAALDYTGMARTRAVALTATAICGLALTALLVSRFGALGAAGAASLTHPPLCLVYALALRRTWRSRAGASCVGMRPRIVLP